MNEPEIMSKIRRLDVQTAEEAISYGSPVHHNKVYIIMWYSERSGGTYSTLRKSPRGRDRFLNGLRYLGVNMNEVEVIEQEKRWVPERKTKKKKESSATWLTENQTTRQKNLN